MRGLTVQQPWASLIALGEKRIETRSWGTRYQGELAIHSSKAYPQANRNLAIENPCRRILESHGWAPDDHDWFPLGQVVAVTELLGCVLVTPYVQAMLLECVLHGERLPSRFGGKVVEVALPIRRPASEGPAFNGNQVRHYIRPDELALGNFDLGRWLWVLAPPVRVIPPIPTRGAQGLWFARYTDVSAGSLRVLRATPKGQP